MYDDGTGGDEVAGDGVWTLAGRLAGRGYADLAGVRVAYKFTWGNDGDGWTNTEEFPGNQRILELDDRNGDRIIARLDMFADETTNKDKADDRAIRGRLRGSGCLSSAKAARPTSTSAEPRRRLRHRRLARARQEHRPDGALPLIRGVHQAPPKAPSAARRLTISTTRRSAARPRPLHGARRAARGRHRARRSSSPAAAQVSAVNESQRQLLRSGACARLAGWRLDVTQNPADAPRAAAPARSPAPGPTGAAACLTIQSPAGLAPSSFLPMMRIKMVCSALYL